MASKLCTKDFELVINPDPTFQGLLWLPVYTSGVAPTWTASKERFSMVHTMPSNSSSVFHAYGGNGTAGGQIGIPAVPQTRHCKIHLDVAIAGLNYNIVPGDNNLTINVDQIVPPAPSPFTWNWTVLSVAGSYDHAFTLTGGKAYTFNIQIDHHSQVFIGGGNFLNLTWSGFVYVETYS